MRPKTNPPNAAQPSDMLAHNGKLDDEPDGLLPPDRRERLRDDLDRETAIFDKFLLSERVRFPARRTVDVTVRAIISSKIIVNIFSLEILSKQRGKLRATVG
ncbi:MAG: hypothetical protein ACHQNE_05660 [Candidatus Kapaibacterium sp.]